MADRYPLIVDNLTQTVKEIPSGDNLNLNGSEIVNVSKVGIGTDATDALHVIGNANITGILTANNLSIGSTLTVTSINQGQIAGFRNIIINGDFSVNQRRSVGVALTFRPYYSSPIYGQSSYDYVCDRFGAQTAFADTIVGFTTTVPQSSPPSNHGFSKAIRLESKSAVGVGSTYFGTFGQPIKVANCRSLSYGTAEAQPLTISFWIKSNLAGTHVFNIRTASSNGPDGAIGYRGFRSYSTTYTINAANTWEYKAITIPGDTVAGVGSTTFHAGFAGVDSFGLGVSWDIGCGDAAGLSGSDTNEFLRLSAPSGNWINSWRTGNHYGAPVSGRQRLVSAPGNYYEITGVQAEIGSVASPFEFIDAGTQLSRCQSYFYKVSGAADNVSLAFFTATNTVRGMFNFPVTLNEDTTRRFLIRSVTNGYRVIGAGMTGACDTLSGAVYDTSADFTATLSTGTGTAGQGCQITTQNSSSYIAVSAEYSEPSTLPLT